MEFVKFIRPHIFSLLNNEVPVQVIRILDRDYSREQKFEIRESGPHVRFLDVVWARHSIESLFLLPRCLAAWVAGCLAVDSPALIESLAERIDDALNSADTERSLLYSAHDMRRQVLLRDGKTTLPTATEKARREVDADPATWQHGRNRAEFVLNRLREGLGGTFPTAVLTRMPKSLCDVIQKADLEIVAQEPDAVPPEIDRLLNYLASPQEDHELVRTASATK